MALLTASPIVLGIAQSVDDQSKVARSVLNADRKATVAETMQFTEAEGKAFWPLYGEYRAKRVWLSALMVTIAGAHLPSEGLRAQPTTRAPALVENNPDQSRASIHVPDLGIKCRGAEQVRPGSSNATGLEAGEPVNANRRSEMASRGADFQP